MVVNFDLIINFTHLYRVIYYVYVYIELKSRQCLLIIHFVFIFHSCFYIIIMLYIGNREFWLREKQ